MNPRSRVPRPAFLDRDYLAVHTGRSRAAVATREGNLWARLCSSFSETSTPIGMRCRFGSRQQALRMTVADRRAVKPAD
jgi:hypothetical protein